MRLRQARIQVLPDEINQPFVYLLLTVVPLEVGGSHLGGGDQLWAVPRSGSGFSTLPTAQLSHSPQSRNQSGLDLVSDLIKLSILKPAANNKYRVEEVAAFLGDYPPISPVPYEKGR